MTRFRAMPLLLLLACLTAAPAAAREVTLAVGRSLAPYVILPEWRGIEYDVVRRAFELSGHTATPRSLPLARVTKEFEGGGVDAAMTMSPNSGLKALYSEPYIAYRNYAITLARRDLTITSAADLADKSVVAFQNASRFLGPEYKTAVERNPRYREEAHQVVQPTLLFLDRIDVVVADRNIFTWFANDPEVRGKTDTTQAVRFHPLFPPTEYRLAFRDAALRDDFDRGLKQLRDSGEYARIVASYARYLKEEQPGLSR